MSGVKALCEMLKVNTTLQNIKCASHIQFLTSFNFIPLGPP